MEEPASFSALLTFAFVKDVGLFLLAIYGAALSTFNWRQATKREKRSVRAEWSTHLVTFNNGQMGPPLIQMKATNIGHRPVTISAMYFELPGGARMFSMTPAAYGKPQNTMIPANLTDGQSAVLYMSYHEIGEALIDSGRSKETKIHLVCEDSAGGKYRSKTLKVDPVEFRNSGPLRA